MGANEHVLHGSFCKRLASSEFGLDIEEIVHRAWDMHSEPNTFADGLKSIDRAWASISLDIGGFKILSFGESVKGHITMILDVTTRSLVGAFEQRIIRPTCRRLNCKTSSLCRYMKHLKSLCAFTRWRSDLMRSLMPLLMTVQTQLKNHR